jgi:hypothetical protein
MRREEKTVKESGLLPKRGDLTTVLIGMQINFQLNPFIVDIDYLFFN